MDVLLIYPHTSTSGIEEGIKVPPLGLAYLGAALEKSGYSVRILDLNAEPKLSGNFKNILLEDKPGIVGITCLTPFYSAVLSLARLTKELTSARVVVGGAHATALPEDLLQSNLIDYIVLGEGESTLVELTDSLLKGKSKPESIKGIAFLKDNSFLKTAPREYIQDLDDLPFPARHLLPIDKYKSPQYKQSKVTSIITSRGCPYSCIFCDYRFLMGPKFRRRSPKNVINEIEECIRKYDIQHVTFRDSTFTFDEKWIHEFCQLLKNRNVKIDWDCNGRVNLVTGKMLDEMKKAGCSLISYGIESGDQGILDFAHKKLTTSQSIEAVKMTKKSGIQILSYIILGLPGENLQTIRKTINLAIKLDSDYTQFSLATPFPGTPLYDYAREHNLIRQGVTWDDFSPINKAILRTEALTFDELEKALKQAYRNYYLRPRYIVKRALSLRPGNIKQNLAGLKMFAQQQTHS